MAMRTNLGYAGAFVVATSCLLAFSYALYDLLVDAKLDLPGTFVQVSTLALLSFLLLLIARYREGLTNRKKKKKKSDEAEPEE